MLESTVLQAAALLLAAADPSAALPSRVWQEYPKAQEAAKVQKTPLLAVVCGTAEERAAALTFFQSLAGTKLRSSAVIWLPECGDSRAAAFLDRHQIRSLPAVVSFDPQALHRIQHFRIGADAQPIPRVLEAMLAAMEELSPEAIQAWAGNKIDTAPFLAFARARKACLEAGKQEPHLSWLAGLVRSDSAVLREWAATRLCEAGVFSHGPDVNPLQVLGMVASQNMRIQVASGNPDPATPLRPAPDELGPAGIIPPEAPFWGVARRELASSSRPLVTHSIYAIFAPMLTEADRGWIRHQVSLRMDAKEAPENQFMFWIALDWLLCFGVPADWDTFEPLLALAWRARFKEVRRAVASQPSYWSAPPSLQALWCASDDFERFWKDPDPCLAAMGATRESLITLGMNQLKTRSKGGALRYPSLAGQLGYSTHCTVRLLVDDKGRVAWMRPQPGYCLWAFAPEGMAFASRWRFEPATLAGKPVPSIFHLILNFKL